MPPNASPSLAIGNWPSGPSRRGHYGRNRRRPVEFPIRPPCARNANENHVHHGIRRAVMTLRVVPEGLVAASARIEALTARLASAQAGSAPLITAVVPAAADPVSVQTAAGFS